MNATKPVMIKQQDMAKRLGVTPRTLHNWDKSELFVARRTPSNKPYYTEEDYIRFIEDGQSRAEE